MQDLGALPTTTATITRLPPIRFFPPAPAPRATRPNSEIARDFMDLSFATESGRQLPILTRFQGPVSLRVTGPVPPTLNHDLSRLIRRLNREARIPVSRLPAGRGGAANITIQIVPRPQFQRDVPQAACFVAPNVSSWSEYRRARRLRPASKDIWAALPRRERLAIFIPSHISPQELRDCLNEELAQALGPINDLYRLPDSVFNDDNFQSILTGFDMLVLRAYYDPALQNGMTPDQVTARLPAILARLNPAGQRRAKRPPAPRTPRAWITLIQAALGPSATQSGRARRAAASQAVAMARAQGLNDIRLGFALYAYGRLSLAADPESALAAFAEASAIYRARPETRIHAASVAWQQAVFALSVGNAPAVIELANANLGAARRAENAALLAKLMMLKAAALDLEGRFSEARAVRLDSLGWARYGFASQQAVRRRLAEIATLAPGRIIGANTGANTGPNTGKAQGG